MGLRTAAVGAATIVSVMVTAALAGSVAGKVMAQVPPPASDWAGLVGQMGIGGILVWYLFYTTSVLMTRIHDRHHPAISEIVTQFREDLRLEREASQLIHEDLRELLNRLGQRPCLLEENDVVDDG